MPTMAMRAMPYRRSRTTRKSRVMVDRYAKFATEHLAVADARIDSGLGVNAG